MARSSCNTSEEESIAVSTEIQEVCLTDLCSKYGRWEPKTLGAILQLADVLRHIHLWQQPA